MSILHETNMRKFKTGEIIKMPDYQFETIDLVLENKWIVTGENENVVFVKSVYCLFGTCHTGIWKDQLQPDR